MKYGFFDDSYTLAEKGYNGSDRLSIQQFVTMGILFVLIIVISILLRKLKKEKVLTIYKVISFVMPILEIAKMVFSGVADYRHGEPYNLGGALPLYTCSMLMYFLPFVAWGKGRMKTWSMAFFASIGLVAGLSNFVYLSAAGWYPLWTFGCLHSIIYHSLIVFVGVSLLICQLYTPSLKTIYEGMIPILLFSVIAIPMNYIIDSIPNNGSSPDYMLLMNANGFIPFISDFFISNNIQFLFTLLMLLVAYPLATAIITFVIMGIYKLVKLMSGQKAYKQASQTPSV